MAHFELQHIQKKYDDDIAIHDFSLKLDKKAFVVLAGPSGCGKSTLLQCIAGLLSIDHGKIFLNEKDITNMTPSERNIAMVFQKAALFPHLTVEENITIGLLHQGYQKEEIQASLQRIASMLSITELLKRKAKTLSGGQQQRVAIARALVREPALFLMDEPLSSLDTVLKTQLRIDIAQLYQKQQATFLYVTHDQMEAMTLADILIVMKEGNIQQIGTPKELYDYPANVFVANFLGRYGMNMIKARIENQILSYFHCQKEINVPGHKQILIGVRAQDLIEVEEGMLGRIVLIEDIGDEIYYHVTVEDTILIMKHHHSHYHINDEIMMGIRWQHALFFDQETQKRIEISL